MENLLSQRAGCYNEAAASSVAFVLVNAAKSSLQDIRKRVSDSFTDLRSIWRPKR